ncbi:MAG: hypothetical protein JW936_00695 [Sedimentisphaerales bacterium]|nr:hypothetical protein [Sedimentisphaerales bacterium]
MDFTYIIFRHLWQKHRLARYRRIVAQANALEPSLVDLDDAAFDDRISDLHSRAQASRTIDNLLPTALAIGREASRRSLQMRHYDVQLMGALALYEGCIAEMDTGEGKTLMAPITAFIHKLGRIDCCTHVVTANEYLAARDAQWMSPLCQALGMSVGLIVPGQGPADRAKAYQHDVVYATAKEIVFDSLREPQRRRRTSAVDSILRPDAVPQLDPKYDFAIVDEVDSVLIDQAGSPFAIGASSSASPQTRIYQHANEVAGRLVRGAHYRLMQDDQKVELKDEGKAEARRLAGDILRLLPVGIPWVRYVTCSLAARYIYKKDQHYVVRDNRVVLIDESTGRMLPGRQLPDGIHQALEVMNGITPTAELRGTYQTTFQTFFRKYDKLAGMTGTAQMAAWEFSNVYNLKIVPIPNNKPSRRNIQPDAVYRSQKAKYHALIENIETAHQTGRPILIGTGSVRISEIISEMLTERQLQHEVLNAKNHAREAEIIAQAGQSGKITVITNMAGRGVDIKLGPGVAELGGMYLLGTDRSAFRRLDDQLSGRVGRQGDPADCRFVLSLKDDILRYAKRKTIHKLRKQSRSDRWSPVPSPKAAQVFSNVQAHLSKITTKRRHHVYLGEKNREQLKEQGMWQDWMDAK